MPDEMPHDRCDSESAPESPAELAPLGREEYVEQAHFFSILAERLRANVPAQEVLGSVQEEVLATTRLPMAIDFLLAELRHEGVFGPAMHRLGHYFTPFQSYVVTEAERERGRFDLRVGLEILAREAEYRAGSPTRQGLFLYQFEALCRNRLGYDHGLAAVAGDPAFDQRWRAWLESIRLQIGMVDIADLIYVHSAYYSQRPTGGRRQANLAGKPALETDAKRPKTDNHLGAGTDPRDGEAVGLIQPQALFGEREGRIALANRRKDPLYLFASLHRQLGYPEVPRPTPPDQNQEQWPQLARRIEQLEKRIKLVEEEQRGGFDLSKFYGPPPPGA